VQSVHKFFITSLVRQSIVRFYWMKVTPLFIPIVDAAMTQGVAESPEFGYDICHKDPFLRQPQWNIFNSTG